jgi:hypothetical protein
MDDLCLNFFNPYVPFITKVLIFLDPHHHLTLCPMDTHENIKVQSL